ncbi:TFIIB-type zinc ribbon-containing protein [Acetivibrio cellulolyticus]|uniref:TFIIB-type zinc ribbon-containing protein n=1 Tax=Acetivibrio cellulolyticus TaxID=35830 RepID=UPI0001E2D505|nr:zf-TFIIB domain-containing protein [Acetivibrio cellulolyticus]
MKCPVCRTISLDEKTNESGLKVYSCSECKGIWVRFDDYVNWKSKEENEHLFEAGVSNVAGNEANDYMPEYDSKKANLCPDCGRILIKYRVSSDIIFNVDHCGCCNGVWLDKNEWAVLVENKLHKKMNDFFTAPWQNRLKEEMTKSRFAELYKKKFGEESYNKLKEIKEWMNESELKNEMLAYLTDDDPYKI